MTRTATQSFKFVGAHVDDLADGRVLEPGQTYKLTTEQQAEPHNKRLFDDGLFLDVNDQKGSA